MRKKIIFFFYLLLFTTGVGFAQISENFSDGDFTSNPTWTGDISHFVVNSSFMLQSENVTPNTSFFLSTVSNKATSAQWEFWVRAAFNTSSANYIDAYVMASAENLSLTSTSGYFVRIGNTDDDICLYRKDSDGVVNKIIDGLDGVLNSSNNVMKIKVTRDASNQWALLRDITANGDNYVSEGKVIDATYNQSGYFGFLIKQSTASFFKKHFFDDIEIKDFVVDVLPPEILSATAITNSSADVLFNEPLDIASSQDISAYSIDNTIGMPSVATQDAANPTLVHLYFNQAFTNGMAYTLTVNDVKDLAGNTAVNKTTAFSFYTPGQYDVLIDELFPDPNPQVGLPLLKFLELKNVSSFPINLLGWALVDGSNSATLPAYKLMPDSFVIVCAANSAPAYQGFGPVIGVANFPSMNIDGAVVVLKSNTDRTIHAVRYDVNTYRNELKKLGGWTLEMIDTKNACGGNENWKASVNATGGTPGRKNSVDGNNHDEISPKLLRAFATSVNTITLVFNEPLDSLRATNLTNYTIDNGLTVKSLFVVFPFFDRVNVTLSGLIEPGTMYNIRVQNIIDCAGNQISANNTARFAISQDADSLDLVINEILFDPLPMGTEYVEIYNRSSKVIDLSKVSIANRNSDNLVSNIKRLTTENILLFPGEFMLLTTDPTAVKAQYITTNPDAFLAVGSMPPFPNDNGNIIILNSQGNIVDEVKYSDKWHFALIHNSKGVSLERIDYDGTSVQSNFHSAATSSGYGTPGYKNSQYRVNEQPPGEITIKPEIFSPDNDGIDDFVTISYVFPSPGYVSNITVFDASGRPVRYLQKNSLNGLSGYYRWDGLDDKQRPLAQGMYIVYTEIFNADGKKKMFKNTVVLARRVL